MSPGKEVKNWSCYEELRQKGHTKSSAAKICNAASGKKEEKK